MNKLISVTLAGLMVAPAAVAGPKSHYSYDDNYRGATEYAQVVSSRPIYSSVRVSQPRQECWSEPVSYREGGYNRTNTTASTILGGLIGGVAGHQFGGGSGKSVATAVGAVVGAQVGQNMARRDGYGGGYERTRYEERCRTVNEYRYDERVEGYDVTYRYNGRHYTTRMPYDPGNRIPVRVDVEPVSY